MSTEHSNSNNTCLLCTLTNLPFRRSCTVAAVSNQLYDSSLCSLSVYILPACSLSHYILSACSLSSSPERGHIMCSGPFLHRGFSTYYSPMSFSVFLHSFHLLPFFFSLFPFPLFPLSSHHLLSFSRYLPPIFHLSFHPPLTSSLFPFLLPISSFPSFSHSFPPSMDVCLSPVYIHPLSCLHPSSFMFTSILLHVYIHPLSCLHPSSFMFTSILFHVYIHPLSCLHPSSFMFTSILFHVYIHPLSCLHPSSFMFTSILFHVYIHPLS